MGGKGANQAVAAARLVAGARPVKFVGVFGNDAHAVELEAELRANGVDVSLSERAHDLPSGQGFVMLSPDGAASSVVIPGANSQWPTDEAELVRRMEAATRGAAVVMLQREIPDRVTLAAARGAARARASCFSTPAASTTPFPRAALGVDYVMPNESGSRGRRTCPRTRTTRLRRRRGAAGAGAARVLTTLGARRAAVSNVRTPTQAASSARGFPRPRFLRPMRTPPPPGTRSEPPSPRSSRRTGTATAKTRGETANGALAGRASRARGGGGRRAAGGRGRRGALAPSRAAVAAMLPRGCGGSASRGSERPERAGASRASPEPRRTPRRGGPRRVSPPVRLAFNSSDRA